MMRTGNTRHSARRRGRIHTDYNPYRRVLFDDVFAQSALQYRNTSNETLRLWLMDSEKKRARIESKYNRLKYKAALIIGSKDIVTLGKRPKHYQSDDDGHENDDDECGGGGASGGGGGGGRGRGGYYDDDDDGGGNNNYDDDDDNHDRARRDELLENSIMRKAYIDDLLWPEIMTAVLRLASIESDNRTEACKAIAAKRIYPTADLFPPDPNSSPDDDIPSTNEIVSIMLTRPYMEQYATSIPIINQHVTHMRRDLEDEETLHSDFVQPTPPGTSVGILSQLLPNNWLVDFLNVFTSPPPTTNSILLTTHFLSRRCFDNILYKRTSVTAIRGQLSGSRRAALSSYSSGGWSISTPYLNYALDLPYHIATFANIIGTVSFTPPKKINEAIFPPTEYTDFQLLVHYAARASDRIDYADFLENEHLYLDMNGGRKRIAMMQALESAATDLFDSVDTDGVFKADSNGGIKFVREVLDPTNPTTTPPQYREADVPSNVMSKLLTLVIDNMPQFLQESGPLEYMSQTLMGYADESVRGMYVVPLSAEKDSPIGRMLNFDYHSVDDTQVLQRHLTGVGRNTMAYNRGGATDVRMRLSSKYPRLPCVHRLYAQLMMAASTIVLMTDRLGNERTKLTMSQFVNWCIRVDYHHDDHHRNPPTQRYYRGSSGGGGGGGGNYGSTNPTVVYGSTLGAVPGLLFHVFISDPIRQNPNLSFRANKGAVRTRNGQLADSYLMKPETFVGRPWMKSFFDAFGIYMETLTPNILSSTIMQIRNLGIGTRGTPADTQRTQNKEASHSERTKGLRMMNRRQIQMMTENARDDLWVVLATFINTCIRYGRTNFWVHDVVKYMTESSKCMLSPNDLKNLFSNTYTDVEHGTAYVMKSPVVFGLSVSRIEYPSVTKCKSSVVVVVVIVIVVVVIVIH